MPDSWVQKQSYIPGWFVFRSKKGKPSRVDNFRTAIGEFPFPYRETPEGFLRLDLNLGHFTELLTKVDWSACGRWQEWGAMWDSQSSALRLFCDEALPPHKEEMDSPSDTEADTVACQLDEIVDMASLTRYACLGTDRRPDDLEVYTNRCNREGVWHGRYVSLTVTYVRKHGLLGRRDGCGPCLQRLTREARAAAMDGLTYSCELCNCFPTLLLKQAKKTGATVDFPSLTRYRANCNTWRSCMTAVVKRRKRSHGLLAWTLHAIKSLSCGPWRLTLLKQIASCSNLQTPRM